MYYSNLSTQQLISMLEYPKSTVSMVLDTDAYNEVDDQFALAYALASKDKIKLEAVYAAPFYNKRSNSPEDGMLRSYQEIKNILKIMNEPLDTVFYGSTQYLDDIKSPRQSDAVVDLINRASLHNSQNPLYVTAIGAITNIASAILLQPDIVNKIVVLWLGGHARHWHHTKEFNAQQDILSARVVFDSGVPLVHFPCRGVVSHLITNISELEYFLDKKSEIGSYLTEIVKSYSQDSYAWSKVIWDIAPIAWLVNESFVPTNLLSSPIITDQLTWSFDDSRHFVRYAYHVHRDQIFADVFQKLSGL